MTNPLQLAGGSVDVTSPDGSIVVGGTASAPTLEANGLSVAVTLSGTGAPPSTLGANGDSYFDYSTGNIYGPKAGGAWGSPVAQVSMAVKGLVVVQKGSDQYANTSDTVHSQLPSDATVGNLVAMAIFNGVDSTVSSVTSPMATSHSFTKVNGASGTGGDLEWWVLSSVDVAAKNVTVTTSGGGTWWAVAFEIANSIGAVDGGTDAPSSNTTSVTVTPVEAGDLLLAAVGNVSSAAITNSPSAPPWTALGATAGWVTAQNKGFDAAWQTVTSTTPVAAAWTNSYADQVEAALIVKL